MEKVAYHTEIRLLWNNNFKLQNDSNEKDK